MECYTDYPEKNAPEYKNTSDPEQNAGETDENPPDTTDPFREKNEDPKNERGSSDDITHNTGTRGRPFVKGQSGNPAGKPKGARNRGSVLAEEILDGEAEAITRKLVELARNSDRAALRLCVERLLPPRRERAVPIVIPEVRTAEDARDAMEVILARVASGELTLREGSEFAKLLDTHVRVLEAAELEQRLQTIEERVAQTNAQTRR